MNVKDNILQLVGGTPLVRLNKLNSNTKANIFLKLEYQNPAGSIKDRLGLAMIEDAEKKGLIKSDTIIVEPTSGNTGVALALVCAVKGYKLILTMPESMSIERRKLLAAYGAELVLTPAGEGMKGAIAKASEISKSTDNSFVPMQFENMSNVEMHKRTTAKEIWNDTDGQVDAFVAGAGTGGTITGVSQAIKELKPDLFSLVVEPSSSAVLSGNAPGPHKIQGIGAGFIPKIMDTSAYDEVFQVNDDDAFETARKLAVTEGVLCGISSGANVFAALKLAERKEFEGKNIVVMINDSGERYLSTGLFAAE